VGGVVAIALITFLVWKFWLKGRRRERINEWEDADIPPEKAAQFTMQRDARMSTHTVASMASTVLTRASNIIQIAYIPGVTNRATSATPSRLVPPVPPIPMPTTNATSPASPYDDQHFFLPGDIRDSTYSGLSSLDGRDSYARTSIAPSLARSSVATTIYRNNAIVSPVPAQTVTRGRAAVVSVKSSQASSPLASTPGTETPPVPAIDPKHGQRPILFKIPSQGGSTVSRSGSQGSAATIARPVPLNITKKNKQASPADQTASAMQEEAKKTEDQPVGLGLRPVTDVSVSESSGSSLAHARANWPQSLTHSDSDSESESDDDVHSRARRSLLRNNSSTRDSDYTEIQDTPLTLQSPFTDEATTPTSAEMPVPHRKSTAALSTVEEERRNSTRPASKCERGKSPFEDDHRV